MAVAVITGASSGIGLHISKMLVSLQYSVFGLSRDFSHTDFVDDRFVPVVCDITNDGQLRSAFAHIVETAGGVDVLVNNAGVGRFGPHETLSPAAIRQMVEINLTAPLILTGLALRYLKQRSGSIINIASTAALYPHRFGAAYAATKAALLQFGESLFDEVRKAGVKVCTLCPDMAVDTKFYEDAAFEPDADPLCHIEPEDAAEAVRLVLTARPGTVLTQMVLRPQRVGVTRKGAAQQ